MSRGTRLLLAGLLLVLLGLGYVIAVVVSGDDPPPDPPPAVTPDPTPPGGQPQPDPEPSRPDARAPVVEELASTEGVVALAVTFDFEGSVAALPVPGDLVNVYGIPDLVEPDPQPDAEPEPPAPAASRVQLLLEGATVLAITGGDHGSNAGSPTIVLAVPEEQAGPLLSARRVERLHLAIVAAAPDTTASQGGT